MLHQSLRSFHPRPIVAAICVVPLAILVGDFVIGPSVIGADAAVAEPLIGYTELQTNLPGGRHANVRTMRAKLVSEDGENERSIAAKIADDPDSWTQFAGWSPDGKLAIINRGWQSPENAAYEEEQRTFRHTAEGWLLDAYLVDVATGRAENVTAPDRVSFYNTIFFWPGDATKLGLVALVDGTSKPYRMDRDGRNKVDLNRESSGFVYGFSSSPDGRRIAYHDNYQVYLADADGANRRRVETGLPFNFNPTWSPDGQWLLFVAGEHYNCHPHVVRRDGTALQKLADRNGYRGVIEFLDVFDFHGGSSDTPVWSADGASVFYTALVDDGGDDRVELFRIALDGEPERLTFSENGVLHYHPKPSADGRRLLYGSKRGGARQLFIMNLDDRSERQVTVLPAGRAAMWPHWRP